MSEQPAITVSNLGKRYRVGGQFQLDRTLPEAVASLWRKLWRRDAAPTVATPTGADRDFWALRDVSFSIAPGEVVGLIGRNGAGKSTLLKILSEITEPTTGKAEIRGRVASLLEVGTGFHPELTGRENIYLNGSILGMNSREIRGKFDQIVEFSGIEQFLDTPVKRYSSGMTVRLAFAVAAHLEPEILIIDEVLAVGDAEFQRRCLGKMQDVAHSGRTVLFVSHNLAAVQSLCTRALLLQQGQVIQDGQPHEVIRDYLSHSADQRAVPLAERTDREGDGRARLRACSAVGAEQSEAGKVEIGQPWRIEFAFDRTSAGRTYALQLGITGSDGVKAGFLHTDQVDGLPSAWPTSGRLTLTLPDPCQLWPGTYSINAALLIDGKVVDFVRNAAAFEAVLSPRLTTRLPARITATMFLPFSAQLEAEEAVITGSHDDHATRRAA